MSSFPWARLAFSEELALHWNTSVNFITRICCKCRCHITKQMLAFGDDSSLVKLTFAAWGVQAMCTVLGFTPFALALLNKANLLFLLPRSPFGREPLYLWEKGEWRHYTGYLWMGCLWINLDILPQTCGIKDLFLKSVVFYYKKVVHHSSRYTECGGDLCLYGWNELMWANKLKFNPDTVVTVSRTDSVLGV